MRIAIVDFLFSWPPTGGADVDVFHVARGLARLGHEVRLFALEQPSGRDGGPLNVALLPFPVESLPVADGALLVATATQRIQDALKQWQPDYVFLTQGYFLKVPLILALGAYKVISRCYAHETACHKDILRFRNGAPCPNEFWRTPDECRRCALEHQRASIRQYQFNAWTREYVATQAWTPGFYRDFMAAMAALHAVVVTTEEMRSQVAALCGRVHVIPNGVDPDIFTPAAGKAPSPVLVIFAPGRMEDPVKGMDMLMEAGRILAAEGRRFEIHATLPEGLRGPEWLRAVGKITHDAMPDAYARADICVVPSLWDEPFGIVALEAMAAELPVCAAGVGGLRDIVIHGETGLLVARGDASELAGALRTLLDNADLRRRMGAAGRRRVLERYRWDAVITAHYPALFSDAP